MLMRVFPIRTSMTPIDDYIAIGEPGLYLPENITEINISVLFTWHLSEVDRLRRAWEKIAPCKIGGVALGDRSEEFTPGKFVKTGCVITSRGCPNKCWFCDAWKREGSIRELKIENGYNVLDSNLLACSDSHINSVFDMLEKQKERIRFTGGLEPKILKDWHIERLLKLKNPLMFFAYDTSGDFEPLKICALKMTEAGFTRNNLCCYCLIGYKSDTFEKAEKRLTEICNLGMMPFAMLYRDEKGETDREWRKFQREWIRPKLIFGKKNETIEEKNLDYF
jgi:hypothetical protein